MKSINYGTKKAEQIIWTWEHVNKGSIHEAYARPSADKVNSFYKIAERAQRTEGYNHDIKVVGANSFNYSTMYSFTDDKGWTFIVYDTVSNTFITPYIIGE